MNHLINKQELILTGDTAWKEEWKIASWLAQQDTLIYRQIKKNLFNQFVIVVAS